MAWFRKTRTPKPLRGWPPRSPVPEGLWVRCDDCREVLFARELERTLRVCPKCGHHFRIAAP